MTDWMKELDSAPVEIVTLAEPQEPGKNISKGSLPTEPTKPNNATDRLERIAKWKNHPVDDLLDWYKDDLSDLAERSDQDLQFIVLDYLDNLKLYGRELPEEKFQPHCVTCNDCQHFTRGNHPHLGSCAAGERGALLGLWDTHLRGCDKHAQNETL